MTYTYEPGKEDLTSAGVPTVTRSTVQKYLKRLRKRLPVGTLRYYFCSEYGSHTQRPHYHAILFNYSDLDLRDLVTLDWHLGFSYIGTVNDSSIAYVTKYVLKEGIVPSGAEKPFALMSTRPALGSNFLDSPADVNFAVNHGYVRLRNGKKQHLPRYYRTKLAESYNLPRSSCEDLEKQFQRLKYPGIDFDRIAAERKYLNPEYASQLPPNYYLEFAIWKQERIKYYEINKKKRSKTNSKL